MSEACLRSCLMTDRNDHCVYFSLSWYRIISDESYGGETKKAYAMTLLRLVHYAKTGELGDRDGNRTSPRSPG